MPELPPRHSMPSSSAGAPQEANARSPDGLLADSGHSVAVMSLGGLSAAAAPRAAPIAEGKKSSRSSRRTKAKKRTKKRDSRSPVSKTTGHHHSRTRRLASAHAVAADEKACASPQEIRDSPQEEEPAAAEAKSKQEALESPADKALGGAVASTGNGNSEHQSVNQLPRSPAPIKQQRKSKSPSPLLVRVLNQVRIAASPKRAFRPEIPPDDPAAAQDATMPFGRDQQRRKSSVHFGTTTLREFSRLSTLTEVNVVSPVVACSLAAIVSLLCLLLLAVLWAGPQPLLERCASLDCRQARAFLDKLMDASVDPCKDFFWHVCRRWITDHSRGTNFSGQALRDTFVAFKRILLDRGIDEGVVADFGAASEFYRACSVLTTLPDAMTPSNLVERFRNETSLLAMTDIEAVLRKVVQLSLLRRVSTLFGVALVDYHGHTSLYLSRAKSLSRKLSNVKHDAWLVDFLTEIVEAVLPLAPQIPSNDPEATFNALMAFDEVVDSNASTTGGPELLSAADIDSLKEILGSDDWIESLNSLLPASFQLTKASPVMCDGFESIKSTVKYFRGNFALGLLYIFLHVLMEAGQFYYLKRLAFDRPDVLARTCLSASQDALQPVWSNFFNNLSHSNMSEPSRVEAIFSRVRELSAQRPPTEGMSVGDRERAITALRHVTLLEHNMSTSGQSNMFGKLNTSEAKLQGDFPSLYTSVKTAETMRRLSDPPSLADVVTSSFLLTARVVYSKLLNAVVLPAALRRPPFSYSTRVPIEFDVASVGVVLAQAVFRAGMPSTSSDATSWFTGNVGQFISCAEESAQSTLRTTLSSLDPHHALELFSLTRAIKIAHAVMREDYEPLRSRRGYHEAWVMAQRTFFRRFCLLVCTSDVGGEGIKESKLRCMLPLLNMVEFTGAFQCNEVPQLRKSCLSL
ncbi:uncharacterized protein LOC142814330 [Rhipicephalus microplus]|uniref:uncharacterized protein LOC142814330 n=1 Tax=Rhipicephalus microplus TaxID=6941 RepID=UPI003F6CD339